MGAYPASKHALAAYTQQLRLELAPQGAHVLHVCPGPIARDPAAYSAAGRYAADSPDVPAAAQAPGAGAKVRAIDPARLAESIVNACERRKAELVMPAKARLLFAVSQLSARWGDWLLSRSTAK
jgi:short-subunit dehydrogenase